MTVHSHHSALPFFLLTWQFVPAFWCLSHWPHSIYSTQLLFATAWGSPWTSAGQGSSSNLTGMETWLTHPHDFCSHRNIWHQVRKLSIGHDQCTHFPRIRNIKLKVIDYPVRTRELAFSIWIVEFPNFLVFHFWESLRDHFPFPISEILFVSHIWSRIEDFPFSHNGKVSWFPNFLFLKVSERLAFSFAYNLRVSWFLDFLFLSVSERLAFAHLRNV